MAIDREDGLPKSWGVTRDMMANPPTRIPYINADNMPEELRPELAPIFDKCMAKWGTIPRFYQFLAHSPALIEGWQLIESRIRFKYLRSDPEFAKILQMVIVKTSIINKSINCTGHNTILSRAAGVTWEQLDAIEEDGWKDTDQLSERERAAVRWADAVTKGTAREDAAAFADLKQYFTTRQIVELTYICGMWNLSARLTEPFHQTVEPPEDRIEFKL